jgi:hypothetical protein
MRVLVVARTRMHGDRVCVGGLALDDGRSLRLLGSDGRNLSEEHQIRPGQVWDLSYEPAERVVPPHVEDVVVASGRRIDTVSDLRATVIDMVTPWTGPVSAIFEGCLEIPERGTAYIGRESRLPSSSTGFWIASEDVQRSQFQDHGVRYGFPGSRSMGSVKFVGMNDPEDRLPEGTLVRFSLSRWIAFPPGSGERCYLQLSGWYN